jgi:hypothetical protein
MSYRLFIDYPINASSTEEAVVIANKILSQIITSVEAKSIAASAGVEQLNYRLGHDEDRQNRNYFVITDSGHASTKKTRVSLEPSADSVV